MEKGVVIKIDKNWCGHPDVAYFKNKIYVVFRMSGDHRSHSKTSICVTSSPNGEKFSPPVTVLTSPDKRWNCPRLSVVRNQLWLICDRVSTAREGDSFLQAENNADNTSIWIMYTDDGETWSEPIKTNITGIVPDRVCVIDDGVFCIGSHILREKTGKLAQDLWISREMGKEWNRIPITMGQIYNFCEGSFLYMGSHQTVCLMRENSNKGLPAFMCYSSGRKQVWSEPIPTRLYGCHRPVLGRLSSGRFLVTYREQSFGHSPRYWARNTFACLIDKNSLMDEKASCSHSIILPLDHDGSKKPDSGYTGWVELPDGTIYIVNYITDNAPKAHIRWYKLKEKEFGDKYNPDFIENG